MLSQILSAVLLAATAAAQDPDTVMMSHDPARYGVVVSATRTARSNLELPNSAAIVKGDELKRRGAKTLADALIDVAGLETGGGTDNGSRLPNIGIWGLKEFDALLITVDGVPVGGPFNPSLAQIPVGDIERIEIVKGPQGSMYGVSGFAGMVQVFTKPGDRNGEVATIGAGAFGATDGKVSFRRSMSAGVLDGLVAGERGDGWQDRTGFDVVRGQVSLARPFGDSKLTFSLSALLDQQDWGSPVPVDQGLPLPGFEDPKKNFAVGGANVEHSVVAGGVRSTTPLGTASVLRNTLDFRRDQQKSVRSFVTAVSGDTVTSEGISLEPLEQTVYEDLSVVTKLEAAGTHELVSGAALTWGHTDAKGIGFDFEQMLSDPASRPDWHDVPIGDNRSFDDKRLYFGVYAHDSWTPTALRQVTLSGGGRWDHASEDLTASGQEVGFPAVTSTDSRDDAEWSGDLGALVRLLPSKGAGPLGTLNAYGNWKSSFKPAAPNLTEAEEATILDPEHTHSIEGGIKGEAFAGQLSFDVTGFQLDFHNMVVGILNELSEPELVNAGHERFKGWEVSAHYSPARVNGLSLTAGWATHDPRFVEFTFVTPDGTFRDVSGKQVELAPGQLYNAGASYAPGRGLGGWAAYRHQGTRPLTRRNTFWTEGFDEVDAGLTFTIPRVMVSVSGRNLGDSRHYVSESDVGDSQFYVAPPQRFAGQVTITF